MTSTFVLQDPLQKTSRKELADLSGRGVNDATDQTEEGEGVDDGDATVALRGVSRRVVELLSAYDRRTWKHTHCVGDTTNHPGEHRTSGELRVEEPKVCRRGKDEGDALQGVLVRTLSAVELLEESALHCR